MTLTSGKIKLANDWQLFLPANLKWHLVMPTYVFTPMILIHSEKWAGLPARYWLRNDNVFSP
jgi:hypothetical protein